MEMLDRNDPRFPPSPLNIEDDRLARQKREHAAKVDEREEFQNETVTISTGPKNTAVDVVLRWPRSARIVDQRDDLGNVVHRDRVWTGGRFVFARFDENETWHKAARDEWEAGARNALEKFCAIRNLSIVQGPRPEDTNRYNLMVETREAIK